MKLSEAMMLGDSLRTRDGSTYIGNTESGYCGCAIGGACLAMGVTEMGSLSSGKIWPWLDETPSLEVFAHCSGTWRALIGCGEFDQYPSFNKVMSGRGTFEELVDFVSQHEPECGECNRFECRCEKQATPVEESVEVSA